MFLNAIVAKKLRDFVPPVTKDTPSTHFKHLRFTQTAIDEYCSISQSDYEKVVRLIRDTWENGLMVGIGKPEHIDKYEGFVDFFSRRITKGDRLRYRLVHNEIGESVLLIEGCKWHYKNDKQNKKKGK